MWYFKSKEWFIITPGYLKYLLSAKVIVKNMNIRLIDTFLIGTKPYIVIFLFIECLLVSSIDRFLSAQRILVPSVKRQKSVCQMEPQWSWTSQCITERAVVLARIVVVDHTWAGGGFLGNAWTNLICQRFTL